MYEQVDKPKENKSRAVANSTTQKKSNGVQAFGFVDNRPSPQFCIQLKKYHYLQGVWQVDPGSAGPDNHALPTTALNGDMFDSTTGEHRPWNTMSQIEEARVKKPVQGLGGKVYTAKREHTTWGEYEHGVNPTVGASTQGPHTVAFVNKRVILDMAVINGVDLKQIQGTVVAPDPVIAERVLRDSLTGKGVTPDEAGIAAWKKAYKRAYDQVSDKFSKPSLKRLMELHPLGTYCVGETPSAGQLAGKNEKAKVALQDIGAVIQAGTIPANLTTVDPSSFQGLDAVSKDRAQRSAQSLMWMSSGREPSLPTQNGQFGTNWQ